MNTYTLDNAPIDDLIDVNRHAPFTCECRTKFSVDVKSIAICKVKLEEE